MPVGVTVLGILLSRWFLGWLLDVVGDNALRLRLSDGAVVASLNPLGMEWAIQ